MSKNPHLPTLLTVKKFGKKNTRLFTTLGVLGDILAENLEEWSKLKDNSLSTSVSQLLAPFGSTNSKPLTPEIKKLIYDVIRHRLMEEPEVAERVIIQLDRAINMVKRPNPEHFCPTIKNTVMNDFLEYLRLANRIVVSNVSSIFSSENVKYQSFIEKMYYMICTVDMRFDIIIDKEVTRYQLLRSLEGYYNDLCIHEDNDDDEAVEHWSRRLNIWHEKEKDCSFPLIFSDPLSIDFNGFILLANDAGEPCPTRLPRFQAQAWLEKNYYDRVDKNISIAQ